MQPGDEAEHVAFLVGSAQLSRVRERCIEHGEGAVVLSGQFKRGRQLGQRLLLPGAIVDCAIELTGGVQAGDGRRGVARPDVHRGEIQQSIRLESRVFQRATGFAKHAKVGSGAVQVTELLLRETKIAERFPESVGIARSASSSDRALEQLHRLLQLALVIGNEPEPVERARERGIAEPKPTLEVDGLLLRQACLGEVPHAPIREGDFSEQSGLGERVAT